MHYKNGREAKNGDKVVLFNGGDVPVIGFLYDARPGNDFCNGRVAPINPHDACPCLNQCLHLDDVLKAVELSPISRPNINECSEAPKAE